MDQAIQAFIEEGRLCWSPLDRQSFRHLISSGPVDIRCTVTTYTGIVDGARRAKTLGQSQTSQHLSRGRHCEFGSTIL